MSMTYKLKQSNGLAWMAKEYHFNKIIIDYHNLDPHIPHLLLSWANINPELSEVFCEYGLSKYRFECEHL